MIREYSPAVVLRSVPNRVAVIAVVVCACVEVPVEYTQTHSVAEAAKALVAVVLALAVALLATSLLAGSPLGTTLRGLAFGGFFVGAGILSWSYADRPIVVWSLLIVEGVVFMLWSRPWLRFLRPAARLGSGWLGVSYWLLGIVGAVLVLHPGVAAQRVLYAGVFGLAVLAVVASNRDDAGEPRDFTVGVAAAFLFAIAALLVSGAGNLFDVHHVVVAGPWGESEPMHRRFWGGHWLLYHPNSLAGIAVAAAIRIGPDRRFAGWQRLAGTVLAGYVVFITNSRTGFVFLGAAGAVHAALLWWRRRQPVAGLAEYADRRALAAATVPFVVLALVLVASGGQGFLVKQRYGEGGMTSGRLDTWIQVGKDWNHASVAEKIFGDAQTARAVVHRESSGADVQLTTDNAAVGALRRGGVLGVVAFLIGLTLLLRRALRGLLPGRVSGVLPGRVRGVLPEALRRVVPDVVRGSPGDTAPAWFIVAALAALPTIATSDWVLGGTGGTLWILLVTGEALVLLPRPAVETRSL